MVNVLFGWVGQKFLKLITGTKFPLLLMKISNLKLALRPSETSVKIYPVCKLTANASENGWLEGDHFHLG